ncbi:Lactoylglutathione lyase [Vitis vinifera]|uniref:Lactoylglutathione lyase n=1 Tax=Vitis vinifera TaxID=29760 RepID=A0A438ISF2_VITVI|nr:Lactoylglutathione lyase [Vitis vinifera]
MLLWRILKATVGSSSRMASTPEPLCQMMLRVADLDLSIKFCEQYTMAMVGYGEMNETIVLELIYTYNVTEYTKGNGFIEVAVSTDDVYKSAAAVLLVSKELGGKIIQPPGPIPVINAKMTSFVDPDDWKIVLIDNEDFLKQLQKKE